MVIIRQYFKNKIISFNTKGKLKIKSKKELRNCSSNKHLNFNQWELNDLLKLYQQNNLIFLLIIYVF